MSSIPIAMRRRVYARAGSRCEYCLIHEGDGFLLHEVDHIVAGKHGGETSDDNLCLCCFDCNRHKGSDLTSIDPITKQITPLFDPRNNSWQDHFQIDNGLIEGLTAIGRTTVRLLQMNTQERHLERASLIALGRYPVE